MEYKNIWLIKTLEKLAKLRVKWCIAVENDKAKYQIVNFIS